MRSGVALHKTPAQLCWALPLVAGILFAGTAQADFHPVGELLTVAPTDRPFDDRVMATAVQEDGSFLVLWVRQDDPNAFSEWHLFARAYDSDGAPRAAAQEITIGAATVRAAAFPDGGYVVAWFAGHGGPGYLRARILDSAGTPAGGVFSVSDLGNESQYELEPRIAVSPGGDAFFVAWVCRRWSGFASFDEVRARRFERDGTPVGSSRQISPKLAVNDSQGANADLAALPDGGFCTAWSQAQQQGEPASVYEQRWRANISIAGQPVLLGTTERPAIDVAGSVQVVAHPDGSCTVAWSTIEGDAVWQRRTHLRRVAADDEPGADHFTTPPGYYSILFGFVTDGHGGAYLLDRTGYGPFIGAANLRHLSADGEQIDPPPIKLPSDPSWESIVIGADSNSELVIAVTAHGTGHFPDHHDVLAQRFSSGCWSNDQRLCLGGRFVVEATWRHPSGTEHAATPLPITHDTGGFWFFSPSNFEMLVKVLDGRGINGHYWVFFGGLTDLEVTLAVTDTSTGARRTYVNAAGTFPSQADVEAFAGEAAAPSTASSPAPAPRPSQASPHADSASCVATATTVCLHDHYRVELGWRDFNGNEGDGHPLSAGTDSAYLWFFAPGNIEMAVKVLDGTAVNGHTWVFVAGLTSVATTLTVTDTDTGAVRTYETPAGTMRSFADVLAF